MKKILLCIWILLCYSLSYSQTANSTITIKVPNEEPMISPATVESDADDFHPGWTLVSKSANIKYFIYKDYVSKEGGIIKIWIRSPEKSYTQNGFEYKDVMDNQLVELRCGEGKFRFLEDIVYSASGNSISSTTFPELSFDYAPPGSNMDNILQYVCKKFN